MGEGLDRRVEALHITVQYSTSPPLPTALMWKGVRKLNHYSARDIASYQRISATKDVR